MRRSSLARPLTAALAAVLVSGALVGCSGFSIDGGCAPAFEPGDASTTVTASGDVGDTPAVEFPTPLVADAPQRSVLVAGKGEPAAAGSVIVADYVYFDAGTGDVLDSGTDLFTASDVHLAIGESLECVTPGSRIAVAGPAADLDESFAGQDGNVVAVLDIHSVFLGKANGVNQLPEDGMPTVVTAVDGEPGITLTYQAAPSKPRTAVIKAGGGAVLKDGDTVIAQIRSWSWPVGVGSTPTLGNDTWATGTPAPIDLSKSAIGNETIYGALEGTKVGSQLLVVLPGASETDSATVFVIDILGILADQ